MTYDRDLLLLKQKVKKLNDRQFSYGYETLSDLQDILVRRRMSVLGSSISLSNLLKNSDDEIDFTAHQTLVNFLSSRVFCFLKNVSITNDDRLFFTRFFDISIAAITSGDVGDECIDNIILLAHVLTHKSKYIFFDVVSSLVSPSYRSMLTDFVESIDGSRCPPELEDAVMGAISIFLDVLPDGISEAERGAIND